ncbi:MAG: hypothetical protein HYY94_00190, partial [Gemmatimonadetes bacterium]|nr:hypothetical protein [Gemmatimonadota bacterium]
MRRRVGRIQGDDPIEALHRAVIVAVAEVAAPLEVGRDRRQASRQGRRGPPAAFPGDPLGEGFDHERGDQRMEAIRRTRRVGARHRLTPGRVVHLDAEPQALRRGVASPQYREVRSQGRRQRERRVEAQRLVPAAPGQFTTHETGRQHAVVRQQLQLP